MDRVIEKLVGLVERLYAETEGYIDNPADAQIWYNRGYANGVVAFLRANDFDKALSSVVLDDAEVHKNEQVMAWHKAYHHGYEMGERESAEVYAGPVGT